MHLEEFADGSTILHRLDPRVKFITVIPLLVLIAVAADTFTPFSGLVLAVFLALLGRLDPKKLLVRLGVVNIFVLMLWLFLPFSYPGTEIFGVGPFHLTREGMSYALSITIKTNAIVLMTIAVFGTSEVLSLAHALVHLKVPRKLVYLFFFFYRYISVLHEEYVRLRSALRIRCFKPSTGMHTYRTYAYLVGMLLVRSYERSERIYNAMLCRGFHGHFPVISHFHLHWWDMAFGGAIVLITTGMLVI